MTAEPPRDLTDAHEELLLVLASEAARTIPPGPVRVAELADLVERSESECWDLLHQLHGLGLVLVHDAGPGKALLNAASLTDLGKKAAFARALVEPKGRVDEFAEGLSPLGLKVLDVVVEQESRNAGAAPTRSHIRTAVRGGIESHVSIEEASAAIDSLLSTHLNMLGGREPSYRVTLRGLLASRWGTNALTILDGMLRLLRNLQRSDPGLFRYSWTTGRRELNLPRKSANLFYITVTRAELGYGIIQTEGDDWWTTPPELDVLLENASGLDYVRTVTVSKQPVQPQVRQNQVTMPSDDPTKNPLAEMLERLARVEAQLAKPENPTVRILEAFDRLDLHPSVAGACTKVFRDGHYRNAVLDAGIALEKYVQSRSGRSDLSGAALMSQVFSANAPLLAFNGRQNQSERDEQEGLMHLFMGSTKGLRNPRAHGLDPDAPEVALEIICLLSFLARQLDRAQAAPGDDTSNTPPTDGG